MANMPHGPWAGGKNLQTIGEAASSLAKSMSDTQFDDLVEAMCQDRKCGLDDPNIPAHPADIPELEAVKNLPTLAS